MDDAGLQHVEPVVGPPTVEATVPVMVCAVHYSVVKGYHARNEQGHDGRSSGEDGQHSEEEGYGRQGGPGIDRGRRVQVDVEGGRRPDARVPGIGWAAEVDRPLQVAPAQPVPRDRSTASSASASSASAEWLDHHRRSSGRREAEYDLVYRDSVAPDRSCDEVGSVVNGD